MDSFDFGTPPALPAGMGGDWGAQPQQIAPRPQQPPQQQWSPPKPQTQPSKPTNNKKPGKKPRKKLPKNWYAKPSAGRYVVVGAAVFLMAFGAFRIIVPPAGLQEQDIMPIVGAGLHVTPVPADRAVGIVTAFSRAYIEGEEKTWKAYMVSDNMTDDYAGSGLRVDGSSLRVIEGPTISGINYLSNYTANFIVSVRTDALGWIKMSVPVLYDENTQSFAITSQPTLLGPDRVPPSPPALGVNPNWGEPVKDGETMVAPVITSFFRAWGAEDVSTLREISVPGESNQRVYSGLADKYNMDGEPKIVGVWAKNGAEDTPDMSVTWVKVLVDWSVSVPGAGEKGQIVTWQASYDVGLSLRGETFKVMDVQPSTIYVDAQKKQEAEADKAKSTNSPEPEPGGVVEDPETEKTTEEE